MKNKPKMILMLTIVILFAGCTSLKSTFLAATKNEIKRQLLPAISLINERDIAGLPDPVQRYFRYCGFIGQPIMWNAQVEWTDVYLKMAPEKDWTKIDCYQFNAVVQPARLDYMKSRFMGILPFEASHMYQDQRGSMRVVLSRLINVVNGKGKEFNESELVTILSEILFVPSYALQSYVSWTYIDANTAKATLSYNGTSVSGIFYFNEKGECMHFDTDDRYYDNHDGTYKKVKWSAVIENYIEQNGIRYGRDVKAIWYTDKGTYEYFKGSISAIRFNITKFSAK